MARYLIDANLPRWFSLWSSEDYEFVHDSAQAGVTRKFGNMLRPTDKRL